MQQKKESFNVIAMKQQIISLNTNAMATNSIKILISYYNSVRIVLDLGYILFHLFHSDIVLQCAMQLVFEPYADCVMWYLDYRLINNLSCL